MLSLEFIYTGEQMYPKLRSSTRQTEDSCQISGPILTFLHRGLSYPVSEEERLVRKDVLVDSWVKRGSYEWCQAACAPVASVQVGVILSFPVAR